MNSKTKAFSAAAIALLFLTACGSSSPLGGILGGSGSGTVSEIRGTVDSVDAASQSVYLTNVSNYNGSMLSNSGNSVRIYFDNRTTVDYQGRTFRPTDLERGDQVSVRVDQSSDRLYANAISVTYNARSGGNYPNGNYPNESYSTILHGTVRSVDVNRRIFSLDTGSGSYSTIQFDNNTPVSFNGRNYAPADLENGDEVDVRVSSLGSNRYQAQDITVTRSISGRSGSSGQPSSSTLRGTVNFVDTGRRTIELQSVSYTGFNRNPQSGGTIVLQYDANTTVDVNGQIYPVSGLERGDVIDVQLSGSTSTDNNSATYVAQRIYLVRNVRGR